MRGLIILCIIFIGACTAFEHIRMDANSIEMGVSNVTLFQVDNTIQGAIVRLARYETDLIFVQLGELPAEVDMPGNGPKVLQKVLEFCNLSFVCELVDKPAETVKNGFYVTHLPQRLMIRVSERVFIKAQ